MSQTSSQRVSGSTSVNQRFKLISALGPERAENAAVAVAVVVAAVSAAAAARFEFRTLC